MRYSRVQSKILELIEEWRSTICQTSKYREDLGFIRDMHRLLSYKGYTFPAVKREDAAVLNPSEVCQACIRLLWRDQTVLTVRLGLEICGGNGRGRKRAPIREVAGADTEGHATRSPGSQPLDESDGWV